MQERPRHSLYQYVKNFPLGKSNGSHMAPHAQETDGDKECAPATAP
jgi:hypothetical protein